MSILKKVGIGIVIVIVIALIAGTIYIRSLATRGLPNYNRNVVIDGIKDEVTIYRDDYAVPHIFAKNEHDLYMAAGYCMAQDRLWQMDLIRRVTAGRLAEIFGEDLVETDLLMRSLRIPEKSRMVMSRTDENITKAVEAFSRGVNVYIEKHSKKLPPEFSLLKYKPEKWEPVHSYNLIGYMAWDLTTAWINEILLYKLVQKFGSEMCQDLIPDVPGQKSVVYPGFQGKMSELELDADLVKHARVLEDLGLTIFSGSNNWAVSGEKSLTGKPIFANDMHLGLFAPGIWYQMHLAVDGKFNVTGVALPGQPNVVCGHNDRIAWGMTNVMLDGMDFYLEKINPDNPNEYQFEGKWRPIEVRKEKIKVKGGQEVEKEIRFTHRGPIISGFKKVQDKAISMRWIGNEYSNEMRTIYLLNRAKNWSDFKEAVNTFISISQNIIYADVDGNIGLYCSAGVPIRKSGDGISVVPGWTGEFDWTSLVPFDDLPHSFNPGSGFVSSANNKTAPNDYPHYISQWFDLPFRIDRIREMLTEKDKLSQEDFKRMHSDHKSKLVAGMKHDLVSAVQGSKDLSALETQSLNIITSWDGILARQSSAASIFEAFYGAFIKNVFADEMDEELYDDFLSRSMLPRYAVDNIWRKKGSAWCDDVTTDGVKETFTDMVLISFKDAVSSLNEKYGSDPKKWEWRKIHQLTLNHPMGSVKIVDMLFNLNRGPFEVGGSTHTVCPYSYRFPNPEKVSAGASQRHIYSLANWDDSLSVIPTGTSGIPASRHYCDQTELYVENKYHQDYFSRSLVEENAKYKMIINGR
ncbi:MAG: penicillin acylase family protein [Deltaproteobacteria bacterium]|nr:penicillin acylase family protein [Deltaproteobacteria bacterium]